MIINSCVIMPIVFNFLYIFLKKLKLIEPSTSVISVAEKNFIGMGRSCREGGGVRGIGEANQTLKTRNHCLCKSNSMLPTSIILAAVWLSVNHLTSEPSKIGAKDSSEKSMAASSLQVELLEHSEGSQSL